MSVDDAPQDILNSNLHTGHGFHKFNWIFATSSTQVNIKRTIISTSEALVAQFDQISNLQVHENHLLPIFLTYPPLSATVLNITVQTLFSVTVFAIHDHGSVITGKIVTHPLCNQTTQNCSRPGDVSTVHWEATRKQAEKITLQLSKELERRMKVVKKISMKQKWTGNL